MKDLNQFLVKESKTDYTSIRNYGRSWISEWGLLDCGNVLSMFLTGVKDGISKYKSDDPKFYEKCNKCIDEIIEKIDNEIK